MRAGLRLLKPETQQWLRDALLAGRLCRSALARGLCEIDGWVNPKGAPCLASARAALPALAGQLQLSLPPPLPGPSPGQRREPSPAVRAVALGTRFAGSLRQLGEVALRPARSRSQRRRCSDLLAVAHPLGRARAPGARLAYLLEAERAGPLGVLSFVAAPLRLGPRDRRIGWNDRVRGQRLPRLLCQDRFLLLPGLQVPHLASHVLGRAARRLAADWHLRHGVRPVALETCVTPPLQGTCYRAAGWECVGATAGRPPGAGRQRAPKTVWMRGLAPGWLQALRSAPRPPPGAFPPLRLAADADWSLREFSRSSLPDGRLRRRLAAMGAAWERHPGQPLPAVFPHPAARAGAYRFLHNGSVTHEDILQPHREALLERCRLHSEVLLVQDTTSLNFTALRRSARGLGPLQQRESAACGLWVHAAVAFTPGRRPLGVSGLEVWARPWQKPPAEREKESRRWLRGFEQGLELAEAAPATRVTVVGDRESDIYELLERQAARPRAAGLLVRAHRGRKRRVKVRDRALGGEWVRGLEMQMDFETPLRRDHAVRIGSRGGAFPRKKRVALTELRIARLAVQPPADRPASAPVPAWVVQVREPRPPAGSEPLEWLLLSSDGEPTAEAAARIARRYEARWGIEEFFRVLKSGARIQDRRLRDRDSLAKCLAFDAVAAWRLFALDRYARDAPRTPAREVFTADEIDCIWTINRARLLPPEQRHAPPPRDVLGMVLAMARVAGWQPTRRRPLPGNEVLWRATQRIQPMVDFRQSKRRTAAWDQPSPAPAPRPVG